MTHRRLIGGGTLALALFLAGCTTDFSAAPGSPATDAEGHLVTQREARDLTFQYRQQAVELGEMARRMEVEAQWYEGRFGEQDERAQFSRERAKELGIAAQEADQLAQEYRRQVPHGQIY